MYKLYAIYKELENTLTLFHFGVVSLALALLIDGVLKVAHVLLVNEVTLGFMLLTLLGITTKLGVLLYFSLSPSFLWGKHNKLDWSMYSTVGSIVGLAIPLSFIFTMWSFGVEGLDNLLIAPLVLLIFNLVMLLLENKKLKDNKACQLS